MSLRVLFAPDKFKGSLPAPQAAAALAAGWRSARPDDELVLLPMADGGDGTLEVLAADQPDAEWVSVPTVDAVGTARTARYLRTGDTAAVELAEICGIAGLDPLDPMGAHTIGLGIVLAAALLAGAGRVVVALGGSASTDGGAGALSALGAQLVGAGGLLPVGGVGLPGLVAVHPDRLVPLPPGGVQVLVDVRAPLFGPSGAAAAFGPQKGADPAQVAELDRGLRRLAAVLGSDPEQPGCGAAGGTGYGLAYWGGELVPGAAAIAELVGLPAAVRRADLVVTGEGRFDAGSLTGKTCGQVLQLAAAAGVPARVVAGSVAGGMAAAVPGVGLTGLTELAGSERAALADPVRWLTEAGRRAALA
ncbi:glycerate kinase [Jatrophihabitans sp.]|uniref:glycerate kinase n=1 Tax=Jatrophihabitans sp. TaxID=1932789 RepID=UPI002B8E355B|nr:glycerate kinase [Jatrophihabitans sp.]